MQTVNIFSVNKIMEARPILSLRISDKPTWSILHICRTVECQPIHQLLLWKEPCKWKFMLDKVFSLAKENGQICLHAIIKHFRFVEEMYVPKKGFAWKCFKIVASKPTIVKNIVNILWTDKMNLKRHLLQTKDPQNVSSQKSVIKNESQKKS